MTEIEAEKKHRELVYNGLMKLETASLSRSALLSGLLDPRREINEECGYPDDITIDDYQELYDREGVANRVVAVLPAESWSEDPEVKENEDPEDTPFEEEWKALQKKHNIWSMLHRIDELSGIGRFGVMLMGFNDGQELKEEVKGSPGLELIYLRVFSESLVTVATTEEEQSNERFGQPKTYSVDFEKTAVTDSTGVSYETKTVHWSRVIHIADNRRTSEVYGSPRIEVVYNRVADIRKVLSGSAEMFWKGAQPGYVLEMDADVDALDADEKTALKTEFDNYFNGLQRYMSVQGGKMRGLAPQVSDPKGHVDTQLLVIAITLGVPLRVFLGSEEGKLASSQDIRTWNKRLNRRQDKYVSPLVIRVTIDRLITLQVLSVPSKGEDAYEIEWPDLNTVTDEQKALVVEKLTKTLALFVSGNVDQIVPPEEFLTMFMDMDPEQVKQIKKASEAYQAVLEEEEQARREEEEEKLAAQPPQDPNDPKQDPAAVE